jgi:hypothetical protein
MDPCFLVPNKNTWPKPHFKRSSLGVDYNSTTLRLVSISGYSS